MRACSRTTVAEQADDASALLDALAATPAVVIGRSYGGAVAIDLALRYPDRVRALVLLEGDALGLSSAGLEWTKGMRDRLRAVASQEGVDAVYEALIEEVLGEGAWDSFPGEVQRTLTDKPVLLVVASGSPPEQREMTAAMADALPNARTSLVGGGHLIDPASPEVLSFIAEALGAAGGQADRVSSSSRKTKDS